MTCQRLTFQRLDMQAVCFFLLVLFFSCTLSDSGDFASIELRAAATGTYNSRVGGGAWNDGTNDQDIKKELQGQDYRCGVCFPSFLRSLKVF